MARGDHRITSNPKPSGGTTPQPRSGNWGLWLVGILIAFTLFKCIQKDDPPIASESSSTSTTVASTAAASIPSPPPPLYARLAQFESAEPSTTDDTNLALVLGGGEYEITYETVDSLSTLNDIGMANVFSVNFDDKSVKGDPKEAEVIILIGSLKLKVADISENDSLYTNILSRSDNINAYFNFSTSERGPPVVKKKKRVIVVGDIADITLPSSYGNSTAALTLLDLNPSKDAQKDYDTALQQYKIDIDSYRASTSNNNTDHISPHSKPTEFQPPAYHPPEYHPPAYHPAPHPARP